MDGHTCLANSSATVRKVFLSLAAEQAGVLQDFTAENGLEGVI